MYYDERRRFGLIGGIFLFLPGLAYLGTMRGCDMAREISKSIEEGQRETHAKDPGRWLDKLEPVQPVHHKRVKGEWEI